MTIPRGDASPSSLELWDTCRLQFKFIRCDGRSRERIATPAMETGSIFHATAQAAYDAVKKNTAEGEKVVALSTLEQLLAEVIEAREAKAVEKMRQSSGKNSKNTSATDARFKRTAKTPDEVVDAVRDLLAGVAPLDFTRTVQVEQSWSLQFTDAEVVGVYDRVDELWNTSTGEVEGIEVVDYKTGEHVIADSDLAQKIQVMLYLVAARERFPEARRIQLRFYWVASEEWSAPIMWTREYDRAARAKIETAMGQIAVARDLQGSTFDAETGSPIDYYPPTGIRTPGTCDRCDFRYECDAYVTEVKRAADPAVLDKARTIEPSELHTPVLLRTRQKLAVAEKIVTGLRKDYDAEIRERIPEGEWAITSGDLTARVRSRGSYTPMPENELVQFLMPVLEPGVNPEADAIVPEWFRWLAHISSVDKKKLAKALEELPKEEAKKISALMKERREMKGAAEWIEVSETERPI